ncbi:MAG: S8 family serine peptidase [Pseudomonadota bacterium]|nr:S8 family serine peptidase [Pseudomonadota bacterium]
MNVSVLPRTALGLAIGLSVTFGADAAALISPDLQKRLLTAPAHEVIVTFSDRSQAARLDGLTASVRHLKELPMSGALLTSAQVQQVAQWEGVESIYFNAPLEYFNHEAGEITGGHVVHDQIRLKGAGVTIAVLDSGIDANHPDLQYGAKTIQNVKIVGDLGLVGTTAYLENQPNSDTSSGHGTHVAGTVAGTGTMSAGDARRANYYDGIAPESFLLGLGAGEGLHILFALQGFDYALANQQRYSIDVITNSWGSSNRTYDPNNPINRASYEAYRRGMVVTFAAGNDGRKGNDTLNPYAIVPWVINVGSGTKAGGISDFSGRGVAGDLYKHIDVIAPGSNICSTRAIGTAIGALGPVANLNYPSYTAYYHCISGTSMATPFVAGTAALLLEANPELSPDQIEQILMQTATPMPGLAFHEVGGGYINVLAAVDLASRTTGNRLAFLNGATAWSNQGQWNKVADGSNLLAYSGNWRTISATGASDGGYKSATVTKKSVPRLNFAFQGSAAQLLFPRNNKGGLADVYVDGVHRGQMSFYSVTPDFNGRLPLADLGNGLHTVEIRGAYGAVYFDGALIDGVLKPFGTRLVEETQTFTGTMGPSVENLQIDEFAFEVGTDVTTIKATITWDGGVDIDFSLVDPNGNEVASGATLANPETLEFNVVQPGTYKYLVKGYATVVANYTLDSTVVRAVTTPQP